ncbi:extracellular solute-binding protein [Streptantibioticus silvisoli]|uniref:Extracellular solute-binding protein n=1 Tax=Streptantibioticus silvisoli TaxID=2705255 RepID=A0ABT6W112_9ACTN|nr:extracellular solute-binding protein [Streptantibioticus silvisoli]MDI5964433.1 extracellular solute-binding protein [Streptantibioticus silvisoli]
MRKSLPVVAAAAAALLLAGCSGSGSSSASSPTPTGGASSPAAARAGTVKVLYAGSLVNFMKDLQPGFDKADSGSVQGESGGSDALVNEIKGKVKQADVFVSASTDANSGLVGKANGDWESWYASFATAPLVIGYNPKSRFAADLKSKPWTEVVKEPGFRMGSTDPKLDPKGKLAAKALKQVGIPQSKVQVFPEEQLLARLASGNLDAAFFYSSEATEQKLPTVSLGSIHLAAQYTVTVLNKAPNANGGQDFVNYLLGPAGQAVMRAHKLTLTKVTVAGDSAAVPAGLKSVVGLS